MSTKQLKFIGQMIKNNFNGHRHGRHATATLYTGLPVDSFQLQGKRIIAHVATVESKCANVIYF